MKMEEILKLIEAVSASELTDFKYEEKATGITITGYAGDKTDVVIPGEIAGKKVTSIGGSVFRNCSSLTSVTRKV